MDLSELQVRMLPAHFLGGPTVSQVIHGNLGYADSRQSPETGWFAWNFLNVWISKIERHRISPAWALFALKLIETHVRPRSTSFAGSVVL
jgi:hypothetical protein